MGTYTKNLFKRDRKANKSQPARNVERLTSCAILLADGTVLKGHRSHYMLRSNAGWDNPSQHARGTQDGFWTSEERFVSREDGLRIAKRSGQVPERFDRELLSSDILWGA